MDDRTPRDQGSSSSQRPLGGGPGDGDDTVTRPLPGPAPPAPTERIPGQRGRAAPDTAPLPLEAGRETRAGKTRPGRVRRWLAGGWGTAVFGAVLALAVVGLLCELIAFGAELVSDDPLGDPVLVARIGGLLFYAAHHVRIVVDVPADLLGVLGGTPAHGRPVIGGSITFAVLGLTVGALAVLVNGGRAVATEAGGTGAARALHGVKIAVPYAVVAGGLSFLVPFTLASDGPGPSVHPSHVGAFLWPLLLASLAGLAGGVRATGDSLWGWTPRERRVRGVLAGGWRMLWVGLLLAFAGMLVIAAARPDDTRAYLETAFRAGPDSGALIIALTALLVPNMSVWLLYPAMGSCTGLTGATDFCLLSYTQFPASEGGPGVNPLDPSLADLPNAPTAYLLFLLVPLIAVLAGGVRATRRGHAAHRGEGALLGASAGLTFALLSLLAVVLATAVSSFEASIPGVAESDLVRFGPDLGTSVLLTLAWGVIGGALGGAAARPSGPLGVPGQESYGVVSGWRSTAPPVP